jgi:hypothetical protein
LQLNGSQVKRGGTDGKRGAGIDACGRWDADAELAPDRRHRVGDKVKDVRLHERPDGVMHRADASYLGDKWGGEHEWVEHQQCRL